METRNLLSLMPAFSRQVIGYSELKQALLSGAWKRARGLKGHLLIVGPPGVGKTYTLKTFAKLVGAANEGQMVYARTTGRTDLMPEEFLADRIVEYDETGKPGFVYRLSVVDALRRVRVGAVPALWHFDEIDKVPPRSLNALLEAMEEQSITLPNGERVDLNFMLVATANGRKFDKSAQELGRALRDRFSADVEINYLPLAQDVEMLQLHVGEWRLPIRAAKELVEGIVKVVKLTQQQLPNFTDFTRHIKVPAGPRGFLDLFQEAATEALFSGSSVLQPRHIISVGRRVLRGRIEVTAEAEINGKPADVLIADIMEEVFGKMRMQVSVPAQQSENGKEEDAGEGQRAEESEQASSDGKNGEDKKKSKDDSESEPNGQSERPISFLANFRQATREGQTESPFVGSPTSSS